MDLYLLPDGANFAAASASFAAVPFGADTGVLSIAPGTYDVYVTPAGNKSVVAIEVQNLALTGARCSTCSRGMPSRTAARVRCRSSSWSITPVFRPARADPAGSWLRRRPVRQAVSLARPAPPKNHCAAGPSRRLPGTNALVSRT